MSNDPQTPGERFKRMRRVESHLTQEAMAERAGVDSQTISDWETGRKRWGQSLAAAIKVICKRLEELGKPQSFASVEAYIVSGVPLPQSAEGRSEIIKGKNPRNWGNSTPRILVANLGRGGASEEYMKDALGDFTIPHSLFPFYDREVDALLVKGASMRGVADQDDIVVFDRGEDIFPQESELVVVEKNGDAGIFVKYFDGEKDGHYLFSSRAEEEGLLKIPKEQVRGIYPVMSIVRNLWTRRTPKWPFIGKEK